nr:A disintegrin and metalloproteinase with thrombospondin motifs 7-like [Chlorocebus sabaeus]
MVWGGRWEQAHKKGPLGVSGPLPCGGVPRGPLGTGRGQGGWRHWEGVRVWPMSSSSQNVCHTLWCSVGTTCHSKLDAAVDGTRCGENKWCLNGECVPVGFRPEAVDGGWSGWSICSRSCGVGVQSAERQCTQPT